MVSVLVRNIILQTDLHFVKSAFGMYAWFLVAEAL